MLNLLRHGQRVRVIVATDGGARGVMGVIDGSAPKGVEGEQDQAERRGDAAPVRLQAVAGDARGRWNRRSRAITLYRDRD